MTDSSTVAILATRVDTTTVALDIDPDPAVAAYWDAVTEVRRFWQAMRHNGPAATDEAKLERIGRLNERIKAAKDAALAIGLDFTAVDFM